MQRLQDGKNFWIGILMRFHLLTQYTDDNSVKVISYLRPIVTSVKNSANSKTDFMLSISDISMPLQHSRQLNS
jgi:hypothetical protein